MRVFIAALAAFALAGGAAQAAEINVAMKGAQYHPQKITAKRGDTLIFTNDDTMNHDVFVPTYGFGVNLGVIKPGETQKLALVKPGRFAVECVFHDTMKIQVTVKP